MGIEKTKRIGKEREFAQTKELKEMGRRGTEFY